MKNSQKWIIIFIVLLPFVTILTAFYIVDISIKDFVQDIPIWLVALLLITMLAPAPAFILARRKVHKISLQKRQKRVLTSLGFFIAFILFNLIMYYVLVGISIWRDMFSNVGFLVLVFLIILTHLYAFFRKDKEQKSVEDSKTMDNSE